MCDNHLTDDRSWLRKKVLATFANNTPNTLKFYMDLGAWSKKPFIGSLFHFICEEYGRYYHGGRISTLEACLKLVEEAQSITLIDCACRKTFDNCTKPVRACLAINTAAEVFAEEPLKNPQIISKEKAKEILLNCHRQGLFHSVHHCMAPHTYAICNCCSCCCVPLRLRQQFGINQGLLPGQEVAVIREEKCISCGKCYRLCPAGALSYKKASALQAEGDIKLVANAEPGKCLGCGLCLDSCPTKAIYFVNRGSEQVMPVKEVSRWQQIILYTLLMLMAFPIIWTYQKIKVNLIEK